MARVTKRVPKVEADSDQSSGNVLEVSTQLSSSARRTLQQRYRAVAKSDQLKGSDQPTVSLLRLDAGSHVSRQYLSNFASKRSERSS